MREKLTLLFLLVCGSIFGQPTLENTDATLTGCIVNATNEPLAGAHVWLVQLQDSIQKHGVTTDADGKFTKAIPRGTYEIRVSYVGYTTYTAEVQAFQDVTLPPIALNHSSNALSEVEIKAKRVVYNIKGYKANIQANPMFKKHSLDNVMRFLPGLTIRPDGIEAYMQGILAVYVNDRKVRLSGAALVSYLSTFEAKNVLSVEVLDSTAEPGGLPGMGSVIKITTIHKDDGGTCSFGLGSGAGPMRDLDASGSINLIYKSGRWNMYAVSMASPYSKRTNENESGTEYLNKPESRLERSSYFFQTKPSLTQVAGISYDLNKRSSLAFDGKLNYKKEQTNNTTRNELIQNAQQTGESNGVTTTETKLQGYNMTVEYRCSHKQFYFNAFASYAQNKNDRTNLRDYHLTEPSLTTQSHNRLYDRQAMQLWTVGGGVRWNSPDSRNSLSLFAEYNSWDNTTDTDSHSETDGATDPYGTYQERYLYKESSLFARTSYSYTTANFSFSIGANMRHTRVEPLIEPGHHTYKRSYTDILPHASISYLINQQKGHRLQFDCMRMVSYPDMSKLNPGIRWTSEYQYSTGNPDLQPMYENHFSLQSTFWGYTLTTLYKTNQTSLIEPSLEEGSNTIVSRPESGAKSRYLAFGLSVPFTPCKGWMLSLGGSYVYERQKYKGEKVTNSGGGLSLTSMNDLPLDMSLLFIANISSGAKTVYMENKGICMIMATLSRSFLKNKLNASLDFYYTNKVKMKTFTEDYHSWSNPCKTDYNLSLKLSYTISWGKLVMKKAISGSSESTRMNE